MACRNVACIYNFEAAAPPDIDDPGLRAEIEEEKSSPGGVVVALAHVSGAARITSVGSSGGVSQGSQGVLGDQTALKSLQ